MSPGIRNWFHTRAVDRARNPVGRLQADLQGYDVTPFAEPLLLLPGQHTIELRNRFYGSEKKAVHVRAGESDRVHVEFKK